ncbi:MAG: phosphatase PAP2 family protein [Treponema sp.]|nr:phosphatase PAP2 family protein [Treponema sp.]
MALDGSILLWIQENMRCGFLSAILIPYTYSGNYAIPWLALILVLLFFKKTRRAAIFALVALILGIVLNDVIIKHIICRPRPFETILELIPIVKKPTSFSCPSGHSATAFATALTLFLCTKKLIGIPALFFAAVMAFSRMYVGVHYPSDVILGIAVGCASAVLVLVLGKRIFKKRKAD